jgi:hypothetical protein
VFDTARDLDSLFILKNDLNGTVELDPGIAQILQLASKNSGKEVGLHGFPFGAGSSDAAAFQQAGIPSGLLVAMAQPSPRWYHTRLDNWDILNPECIEFELKIGLEAVLLFDENENHGAEK